MNVVADLFALRNQIDQFSGTVFRVRGHKADAEIPLKLFDLMQQLCKVNRMLQTFTVRVYILTQKENLLVAHGNDFFCLTDNLFRLTPYLSAADIRNDAVGTEVVTAIHDLKGSLNALSTLNREVFGNTIFSSFSLIAVNNSAFSPQNSVKKFRHGVQNMGSENQFYKRIALSDLTHYFILLHHTATQANQNRRICLL